MTLNKTHIQLAGLIVLFLLSAGLLYLIGFTFDRAVNKMSADGKVPIADAGMFTAYLLSFQQTVTAIRSIWESQERTALAENLSNSTPWDTGPPPKTAVAAAKKTAAAAQDEADHIRDQAKEGSE